MTAISTSIPIVAFTNSSSSSSSSFYYHSRPSVFANFRLRPNLGSSFAVKPLSNSARTKRRANSVARANLGLTEPKESNRPEVAFTAEDINLAEWKGDILAVGVTEKDMEKDHNSNFKNIILQQVDLQLGGLLSQASSEENFSGKARQSIVLRLSGLGWKRVGLFGIDTTASPVVAYRGLGEAVGAAAKSSQASNVAVTLASSEDIPAESKPGTASAIAIGVASGAFDDNRFKSESTKSTLKSVDIIGLGAGPEFDNKLKYAEYVCSGIILAKELVNAPANVLTPGALADAAREVASDRNFTLTILDEDQCKELKMGAFLGVTAASALPPYFIHLKYMTPTKERKIRLALVAKGLTFDSGGYNIRTGADGEIELMKNDMAAAAALLGAAKVLDQMNVRGVEVHFIIPACENMISGTGMHPGDILTASNGKTIEVNNTDAEGRLVLCDALVYACNIPGVEKIVDMATLTFACVTALGPSIAGVFAPDDGFAKEILRASELGGEKFWQMPMEESYWDVMKSEVADMINLGILHGGATTGALFLKQFVDEKVKWSHVDMAGPIMDDKNLATGFGVSTVVEWVLLQA